METQRIRYIYEIKNKVNGNTYIGQHTLRKGRTFETDVYYGSGVLISKAQRKYGLENFEKTIIISGYFSKGQINRFERCMIACQRICGKAEYNLANGGDGGDTSKFINYNSELYHKHLSDSIRKAFVEGRMTGWKKHDTRGMLGKCLSEETKQKLRESHLGEKNPQYGKKQSNETRRKKYEARLKSHNELFSKIRLYLEQLNLDKISMKDKVEIGKKFDCSYKTVERVYKLTLSEE